MLFGNLNAVVDWFLHPEIPYFDHEHIIVGGMTGLAVTMLLALLWVYEHHLKQSLAKIEMLESILPICLHCKKIQMTDENGTPGKSWQSIESYFTRHTTTKLSHGICPDCARKHYPNFEEAIIDETTI
jgi:hypothetical protein